MSARDEFLRYLGAAGGTIVFLFLAQAGLRSCIDLHYHEELAERPANQELLEVRQTQARALAKADIEAAMAKVAKGRQGIATITPAPSDDLSAMSGWIHSPGHSPYTPSEPVVAPEGTGQAVEASATEAGGSTAADGAAGTPAPAAAAATEEESSAGPGDGAGEQEPTDEQGADTQTQPETTNEPEAGSEQPAEAAE